MAVYTLRNISTQMKFWKVISMQFVQVRSQNRSVPSRLGDMAKIYQYFMILSRFFVMLVLLFCLSSMARLISLL